MLLGKSYEKCIPSELFERAGLSRNESEVFLLWDMKSFEVHPGNAIGGSIRSMYLDVVLCGIHKVA